MNSANLKTFDVAPFLQELSAGLLADDADRNIHLSVQAAPLDVGLDFGIPLGLLVTELVANARDRIYPAGPARISVTLAQDDDGTVAIVVTDNGQDLTQDGRSQGLSIAELETSIIAGLANQLGGATIIRSEDGARTEVRIASPKLS